MKALLLTCFEPFGGRNQNRSELLARAMPQLEELKQEFDTIEVCRLPVVYDVARGIALDFIRTRQAQGFEPIVVSFGECSGSQIRIETGARNLDDSHTEADNSGQRRQGVPVVPGAPDRIDFGFPIAALASSPSLRALKPLLSEDAGSFLCNHLAFGLAHELSRDSIPYLFIHVGRDSEHEPAVEARAIAAGLSAAWREALV
jgi:pyroglutamyl-peptidase